MANNVTAVLPSNFGQNIQTVAAVPKTTGQLWPTKKG